MDTIIINCLESNLTKQLEQRATQHGHTIEAEIKAILESVLMPEISDSLNLAEAIANRFKSVGDFELAELTREPIREISSFETTEV
jgi:antitoxin FitA